MRFVHKLFLGTVHIYSLQITKRFICEQVQCAVPRHKTYIIDNCAQQRTFIVRSLSRSLSLHFPFTSKYRNEFTLILFHRIVAYGRLARRVDFLLFSQLLWVGGGARRAQQSSSRAEAEAANKKERNLCIAAEVFAAHRLCRSPR